jgi:hypothetical protein
MALVAWSPPWANLPAAAIPSTQATDAEVAAAVGAMSIEGDLIDRPAAGTSGRTFFASDEGVLYRDNGATWDRVSLSSGDERAYAEKKDSSQTSITTRADITGLSSITFDVLAGEVVVVELFSPWNTHSAVGGVVALSIADGDASVKSTTASAQARAAPSPVGPLLVRERITTPGSYTRKGMIESATSAASLISSATIICSIRAIAFR